MEDKVITLALLIVGDGRLYLSEVRRARPVIRCLVC